ncbi:hypothetical protein [Loktanella sp. S4079]|uniref:hypothetical protein n=1 Tax=Loktanella sp. S4079 TaxID=579483 RepID=UPI0012EE5428|nr:hypothetical protein [Loktanella sp. S4079]
MKQTSVVLGLLMAPASAWAACPNSADLNNGIQLVQSDGLVEVFRSAADDYVQVDVVLPDGEQTQYVLARGVYLVERAAFDDGEVDPTSRVTNEFETPAARLPLPQAGTEFRGNQRVHEIYQTYDEKVHVQWQDAVSMNFGRCSYTVIPGHVEYVNSRTSYTEGLHYLPQLGLAYVSSYQGAAMDAPSTFRVVRIEKAKG